MKFAWILVFFLQWSFAWFEYISEIYLLSTFLAKRHLKSILKKTEENLHKIVARLQIFFPLGLFTIGNFHIFINRSAMKKIWQKSAITEILSRLDMNMTELSNEVEFGHDVLSLWKPKVAAFWETRGTVFAVGMLTNKTISFQYLSRISTQVCLQICCK